jgi:Xaa-Pro aminopeptidase
MGKVASVLRELGCEGLLLLEPENFAWLTSGATSRGLPHPAGALGAYCNGEQRWLLASNVSSPRLFDEELDGMGFQLKEWPWHWGREQLLGDLCHNRKVAWDQQSADLPSAASLVRRLRRQLTPYEQACQRALGQVVVQALETACRNLTARQTERELAGQVAQRLIQRGAFPLHVGVAADDRSRVYRRYSFTRVPVRQYAVLTATARKFGLVATASRSVCLSTPSPDLRREYNAACLVTGGYLAATRPGIGLAEALQAGRDVYRLSGFEHEWLLSPQGHVTGRAPVELLVTPQAEGLFQLGWSIAWSPSAGAAGSCDTFLVTPRGPECVTPPGEGWPGTRVRILETEFDLPDLLQR